MSTRTTSRTTSYSRRLDRFATNNRGSRFLREGPPLPLKQVPRRRQMALLDQMQRKSSEADGREAERYRVAAEDALQQLEWTIGYLHGIRKTEISKALAKNRYHIRRSLMRKADVQDPSDNTSET